MNSTCADTNDAMVPMNDLDVPVMTKKIGRTTYEVAYYFSATSSETMKDKIRRLIRQEAADIAPPIIL